MQNIQTIYLIVCTIWHDLLSVRLVIVNSAKVNLVISANRYWPHSLESKWRYSRSLISDQPPLYPASSPCSMCIKLPTSSGNGKKNHQYAPSAFSPFLSVYLPLFICPLFTSFNFKRNKAGTLWNDYEKFIRWSGSLNIVLTFLL